MIPDKQTIADAYVYLLSRALVIRQERIDLAEPGFAYNKIKYNPLGSAAFVNPNFDVAYLEAWIAVDERHPVLLEVPNIKGRYYTAQLLDEWGEVIANINERTFPSKPFGTFALVQPGSAPKLPDDASRIELHSSKAKLLARVELRDDVEGALWLQKLFKLTALGKPDITRPPALAMFNNANLIGVEIFDELDAVLASALDVSPIAAQMQRKVSAVASYVASSEDARHAVDKMIRDGIVPQFKEYVFAQSAPYHNHWLGGAQTGNYGANFALRTAVNYAGIWANTSEEAIYFTATHDESETPFNGSGTYVMHFAADALPSSVVDAYWSVILVGIPDYFVVQNSLNRYNLNTYSPLKFEADGSLKIAIAPEPVDGVAKSNWLPSPPGKPFALTFRTYVPKIAVKQGRWSPPAVASISLAKSESRIPPPPIRTERRLGRP
jgi:hypothetical protein